jgi:hypothetical protein
MAKKSKNDRPAVPAVSLERARRLIQLVQMLSGGSLARSKLMRPLRLDVRGFYRDLQCLRSAGIEVALENGKYTLQGKQEDALSRVPFPDPGLCFGEAVTLSKGQTAPHQRLKQMVSGLLGSAKPATAGSNSKATAKSKAKKSG